MLSVAARAASGAVDPRTLPAAASAVPTSAARARLRWEPAPTSSLHHRPARAAASAWMRR
eukprot:6553525-Alexandrium_andersonii.AAC.1